MAPPTDRNMPLPGPLKVMISSTSFDLPNHRKAVVDAVLRAGCFPLAMEHGTATSGSDAIQFSLDMVDQADVHVGIFGHRYGFVPDDPGANPHGWSVTEHEYRRAVERRIPVLDYLMHDDHPITKKDVDQDPSKVAKLEALKDELRKGICGFFSSAQDLHSHVIQGLSAVKQSQVRETHRIGVRLPSGEALIEVKQSQVRETANEQRFDLTLPDHAPTTPKPRGLLPVPSDIEEDTAWEESRITREGGRISGSDPWRSRVP